MRNEEMLAENSVLDGIRLSFASRGEDVSRQRYAGIIQALIIESGWTEAQVVNYVKFNIVKSGKASKAQREVYFIGGALAKFFVRAGFARYWRNVTEIHAKFYLVEEYDGAHNAFTLALATRAGKFVGAYYPPNPGKRNKRAQNTAGHTIGNPKSGVHVTVNKYKNERTGVEGHVQGKVLGAIRNEEERRQRSLPNAGDENLAFQSLFSSAAHRTARRFLRAVRSRGIVLTDYFKGVTYISWERPLHDKNFDPLDAEQERQAVAFSHVPGFYNNDDRSALEVDDE